MAEISIADAIRLAVNLLRDSAESRRMPSGVALEESVAELHAVAAETLEDSLPCLSQARIGHEGV